MRALSIRQPWAELILRGIKTVEYRSRPTRILGERFHIYAAGKWPPPVSTVERLQMERATRIWSGDLAMVGGEGLEVGRQQLESGVRASGHAGPPEWMLELMAQLLARRDLPTGVIVGSAIIRTVTPPREVDGLFRWHLAEVERAATLRKPNGHPQPVWFEPFPKALQTRPAPADRPAA